MIVMPSNNSKWQVHYWQGKYGGLGHLYSPGGQRGPYPHLPYALDNGAYGAFIKGQSFDEAAWLSLLEWARYNDHQPLWVLIPDRVGDKATTLYMWSNYAATVRKQYGWPLAFAAQDGMTPDDVPQSADVVFLGGSTEWKLEAIPFFCSAFKRVHVGRVNTIRRLTLCLKHGAESCDGTGWFRGDKTQLEQLRWFLENQHSMERIR